MKWRVEERERGMRLAAFINARVPFDTTKRAVKRALELNSCLLNGAVERFASTIVQKGDVVEYSPPQEEKTSFDPERILYEDAEILLFDKPTGLTCDSQGVLAYFAPYNKRLFLVHRLDKETTGVLLLAKKKEICTFFEKLFRKREVNKRYLALVDGIPKEKRGKISHRLKRGGRLFGQVIMKESPSGLEALTLWNCLRKGTDWSLLECFPKTGRTHQIRAHLCLIGHPILGDYQYAREEMRSKISPKRVLLHAAELSFSHPVTGEVMTISAPLPQDMQGVLG